MDTNLKDKDRAEQAAALYALKRGWGVLKPIGDRLPYDLVFDTKPNLVPINAFWKENECVIKLCRVYRQDFNDRRINFSRSFAVSLEENLDILFDQNEEVDVTSNNEQNKKKKLKGEIAEQIIIIEALKRGLEVLKPYGDSLPYDLVFDVNGKLIKVQVKAGYPKDDSKSKSRVKNSESKSRVVDLRLGDSKRSYNLSDFDFGIFCADVSQDKELDIYVVPIEKLTTKDEKSGNKKMMSTFCLNQKAQPYKDNWESIENF